MARNQTYCYGRWWRNSPIITLSVVKKNYKNTNCPMTRIIVLCIPRKSEITAKNVIWTSFIALVTKSIKYSESPPTISKSQRNEFIFVMTIRALSVSIQMNSWIFACTNFELPGSQIPTKVWIYVILKIIKLILWQKQQRFIYLVALYFTTHLRKSKESDNNSILIRFLYSWWWWY